MKLMKRCLSLLLCAAALLSAMPAAVYAADEEDQLPEGISALEYLEYDAPECSVFVITFAPMYESIGTIADVTLTYTEGEEGEEQTKSQTFTGESILAEMFDCGEETCPQLFIRMPGYPNDDYDMWTTGTLEIKAGAFCAEDGSASPAYSIPMQQFRKIYYEVIARTDMLIDYNQVLSGACLAPEVSSNAFLAGAWTARSRFFLDGQALEFGIVEPKKGMRCFHVQMNDFVYDDAEFEVVSRIKGKAENMKLGAYGTVYYLFKIIRRLPVILLVPVFGPLAALQYCEYAWAYTKYFFANLFGITTYEGVIA